MKHADRIAAFEAERKLITIEEQTKELKSNIENFEKEKEIFKAEKEKYIADMEILNKFLIDNNLTIRDGKVFAIGKPDENKDSEEITSTGETPEELEGESVESSAKENKTTLPDDIDSYTKKEILEYCKSNGIDINETLTKDEILKYLKLEK